MIKMTTKKEILEMGTRVKVYMAKNKSLPKTVGAGDKTYSIQDATYLMASFVANPKDEIKQIKVAGASGPTGDRVNREVITSTYKSMASRCANYIQENKKLPNYVIVTGTQKCSIILFILQLAKIIEAYSKNGKLPTKVLINSADLQTEAPKTSSVSLKSYMTSEGCSGMGQCTGYYCGCNSLQQCFYRLTGILVSEYTIASIAGTTTAGTDHDGLNTAVYWFNKKYNKNIKITWKNFSDLGSSSSARWSALQSYINNGAVFCHLLYRNQWGHYEVPKSVGEDYLQILNSLGDQCGSGTYCGYIESRSKSEQLSYIGGISQKSIAILTNG